MDLHLEILVVTVKRGSSFRAILGLPEHCKMGLNPVKSFKIGDQNVCGNNTHLKNILLVILGIYFYFYVIIDENDQAAPIGRCGRSRFQVSSLASQSYCFVYNLLI